MTAMTCESLPIVTESRLALAVRGDETAFEEIVKAHESMVYSIAWHALRNTAVAEEIAQEVFLSLFRSLPAIEGEAHLIHWLRRSTSHRVIDYQRRNRLTAVSIEAAPDPATDESGSDPWLEQRLRHLVGELPTPQRLVVTLRFQEEMKPGEIASVLEMPVNTVKSHLRRALSLLRERLESTMEGSNHAD